ncbi:SurA N-terminal domain-containing protein [Sphingomonas sp. KR1UV-12]|uniref:Parvulin-like PPIase n=1 Tax=Sphingomonas aurea TaxID=3063994 RepID=A0ABT9EH77_9SPHN|nr:SurA N-terminal domain-containing protein [Sphingomonas sp. KR1UV-12]MDP1026128.1 SurA N-terminal domain-containing protein [Sphingomonas sp. KR1UV-12]
MLSFFRRLINSKVGVIVTFVVLGVIALAFAAGDVSNIAGSAAGIGGNDIAKIGKEEITVAELRQRAGDEVAAARRTQPTADMAGYLQAGALEQALDRMIGATSLAVFGRDQGMAISKRLVDGQIASIPALQGPTGKFDENLYRRILAERKLTDAGIRKDIAQELLAQQLTAPTVGAASVGEQMARPYAALMLERRQGQAGFIPTATLPAGPAPTAAELQAFYGRNLSRYRVPERRSLRYALVTPEQVRAAATPTEAEVARAYQQNRAAYQASEKRTVSQVIVADQAGAQALAAKVRAGTSLADAARAAGLEASTLTGLDKAALTAQSSAAVADAAFGAAKGAVLGPIRGPLGFAVVRVDAVEQVPARTLDQVRPAIVAELTQRKAADALATLHDKLDDALGGGATFDEAIADAKLQPRTTPALTATGIDPAAPAQPDPALQPLLAAAFSAAEDDAPQLVQTDKDGSFAVVAVGQIVPAAPRPLADIRAAVTSDLIADRRRQAARRIAGQVLAAVNKGTPLAQAMVAAGVAAPQVKPLVGTRAELARQQAPDPAMATLFGMAPRSTRLVEAPQGAGWLIVRLDGAQQGDVAGNPTLIAGVRSDLGRLSGNEFAQQFARAARTQVGVKTNASALAKLKAELAGQGGSDN